MSEASAKPGSNLVFEPRLSRDLLGRARGLPLVTPSERVRFSPGIDRSPARQRRGCLILLHAPGSNAAAASSLVEYVDTDWVDVEGLALAQVIPLIHGPKDTTVRLRLKRASGGEEYEVALVRELLNPNP